ncbi:MAG: VanW family protein [Actinobacteria bacterium]|nr:VanW family protein [Actinomycetota bacterium]MBW3648659.1 VanW family protein [Actinomycetota bacterium]
MRGKLIGAALVATLATGAAGVTSVVVVRAGEALPGTSVAGVDVAQQDRAALLATVQGLADARTTGDLPVVVGDLQEGIARGLTEVDVESTVDRALSAGRVGSPLAGVLGPLLAQGDRDIELAVTVDRSGVRTRLNEIAEAFDQPPAMGGFTVSGVTVTPQLPQQGRTLDRDAAQEAVIEALSVGRKEAVALPVVTTDPPFTAAQVEEVSAKARRALGTTYGLGSNDTLLRLTPQEVGTVLRSTPVDGALALTVDQPALTALVTKRAASIALPPREAGLNVLSTGPVLDGKLDLSFTPIPAQVQFTPSVTGRTVDIPAAVARLNGLILAVRPGGDPLPLVITQPKVTTEAVQSVNSLIGTFTTYYQAGQPRAKNIALIARIVDGTTIAPGGTMSLNETAGRRTRDRGFLEDGAILDGELVQAVGGGVSQFATTLFNAAFFAGLPIPAHQPHSFYISRYPVGRESTVNFPSIDVKIVNDTKSAVIIKTRSTPSSVTVELYGNNGGRLVTAQHGPRQPRDDGGFRIAVTRTVSGGDGVSSRRVFTTSYNPAPPG